MHFTAHVIICDVHHVSKQCAWYETLQSDIRSVDGTVNVNVIRNELLYVINVKNEVYKKRVNFCGFRCATMSPITVFINTVIGDVVAHLKPQNSPFRHICNVLFHHYSASSILLIT